MGFERMSKARAKSDLTTVYKKFDAQKKYNKKVDDGEAWCPMILQGASTLVTTSVAYLGLDACFGGAKEPKTNTPKDKESNGWFSFLPCCDGDKNEDKKDNESEEKRTPSRKRKPSTNKDSTNNGGTGNNKKVKTKQEKKNGDGKKKAKEDDEKKDNTMIIVIIVIIVAVILIGGGVTAYCMCAGGPDDQLYDEELGHDGL